MAGEGEGGGGGGVVGGGEYEPSAEVCRQNLITIAVQQIRTAMGKEDLSLT